MKMDMVDFMARYDKCVEAVDRGNFVTVIPFDGGCEWRQYEVSVGSISPLFEMPERERVIIYTQLVVRRVAVIAAHGPDAELDP